MIITTKQLNQIIKEELSKVLNEIDWYDSPDFDYPAKKYLKKQQQSKRVVVFSPDDSYDVSGDTHGRDSHAIKHLHEMDPAFVQKYANRALIWIQNELDAAQQVYVITPSNPQPQPIDKSQVTLGDMINLFDHINDKMIEGGSGPDSLLDEERAIYSKFMAPIIFKFERLVSSTISKAIDVSDNNVKSETRLKFVLQTKRPVIHFKASFLGNLTEYWLDTKTSDLLAKGQDDTIATFMRVQDKGKTGTSLVKALQDLRSNRAMVLEPEYSILQGFIDKIYGDHQAQIAADKERKRVEKEAAKAAARAAAQTRKPKGNPVEFAKQMFARGTPKENIKKAIMDNFKKTSQAADGIMRGAGIP